MELVLQVQDQEMLVPALESGADAVAVFLPADWAPPTLAALKDRQAQARRHGGKFYLVWDQPVPQRQLSLATELLRELALFAPDALQIRDLALHQLAAALYPQLTLHAAGTWGCFNSPALKLAEGLGFARVAVAGPVTLKDLALMHRQASIPLEVALPPFCPCYAGLGLANDYPDPYGHAIANFLLPVTPAGLIVSLEALLSLCQLGVEAVSLPAGLFTADSLTQVVKLYQGVAAAPTLGRPRALAAARQVVEAFGDRFPAARVPAAGEKKMPSLPPARRPPSFLPPSWLAGHGPLWVEARDYPEAAALSRPWRGPILLALIPENYTSFLGDHRRWQPRRLVWRLPLAVFESSLAFYHQALATLCQGRYSRFVAGDWGGVALARAAGGEIWADMTLGLRNSSAVAATRNWKITRVCLPPGKGPADWQELLAAAGGRFWSYLYHHPALVVCGPEGAPAGEGQGGEMENSLLMVSGRVPINHREQTGWLKGQSVAPLVAALPRSRIPAGELPAWLRSQPPKKPATAPGPRRPQGK